jgi:hypothetical protein
MNQWVLSRVGSQMENTKNILKDFILLLLNLVSVALILVFIMLVIINFNSKIFFITANDYIKIILSSWPGAILVLGVFLFNTQKESISYFIKNRLISAGFDGIIASPKEQEKILDNQDRADEKTEENTTINTNTLTSTTTPPDFEKTDYRKLYTLESIYTVIFGSQIKLLEKLRLNGEMGLSYQEIAADFEKTKIESWNHMTEKWTLDKYLSFLISQNLIEKINIGSLSYKISVFGIEFLDHLEKNNYKMIKSL